MVKKKDLVIKTFKKSSKFVKPKTNANLEKALVSSSNIRLKENQLNAIQRHLLRYYKPFRATNLFLLNKTLCSKALGTKLGSGKGKIKSKLSCIRKHQVLFTFSRSFKLNTINKTLSSFTKLTSYKPA